MMELIQLCLMFRWDAQSEGHRQSLSARRLPTGSRQLPTAPSLKSCKFNGAVVGLRLPEISPGVEDTKLWRSPQEGRPIGYASVELDIIASVEQARRQADVTVFEPTGVAPKLCVIMHNLRSRFSREKHSVHGHGRRSLLVIVL